MLKQPTAMLQISPCYNRPLEQALLKTQQISFHLDLARKLDYGRMTGKVGEAMIEQVSIFSFLERCSRICPTDSSHDPILSLLVFSLSIILFPRTCLGVFSNNK